jgi:hypothetical protein
VRGFDVGPRTCAPGPCAPGLRSLQEPGRVRACRLPPTALH